MYVLVYVHVYMCLALKLFQRLSGCKCSESFRNRSKLIVLQIATILSPISRVAAKVQDKSLPNGNTFSWFKKGSATEFDGVHRRVHMEWKVNFSLAQKCFTTNRSLTIIIVCHLTAW